MATNTAGDTARQDQRQVVNTLKHDVNYNDAGISSGVAHENPLPLGAFITDVTVEVITAFTNGGVMAFGTNASSYNDIVANGDVDWATAGTYKVNRGLGRSLAASASKSVYAKLSNAPGAGRAMLVISYEGGWSK